MPRPPKSMSTKNFACNWWNSLIRKIPGEEITSRPFSIVFTGNSCPIDPSSGGPSRTSSTDLFTRLSATMELENYSKSLAPSSMDLLFHSRRSICNSWSELWFLFTNRNALPCIISNSHIVLFSTWKKTLIPPRLFSMVSSNAGHGLAAGSMSCFWTSWKKF